MTLAIRPLRADDLPAADRLFRLAFGTFVGLPDPMQFAGDSDWTRPRFLVDPGAAFAAVEDDALVGANFTVRWGRVAFFGPLCVQPERWDGGIGRRLLDATMDLFGSWDLRLAGLYTFAQSPKHVHLYARYGFWPRALLALLGKRVDRTAGTGGWSRLSAVPAAERAARLAECRALTEAVFEGLDPTAEMSSTLAHGFGDVVLLDGGDRLDGLALCHVGAGSEAGGGACYLKLAAVRPGPDAPRAFARLLDACEAFATSAGAQHLVAGGSFAREPAYRALLHRGFRAEMQGVTMHRANDPGYHHPDAWVIDDWR